MPKVLVIYHSQSGNTEEMAKAVAEADPNTVSCLVVPLQRSI